MKYREKIYAKFISVTSFQFLFNSHPFDIRSFVRSFDLRDEWNGIGRKLCSFPRSSSSSQGVHKLIVDGPVMVGRHANESRLRIRFRLSRRQPVPRRMDRASPRRDKSRDEQGGEGGGVASFVGGEISSRNARAY